MGYNDSISLSILIFLCVTPKGTDDLWQSWFENMSASKTGCLPIATQAITH